MEYERDKINSGKVFFITSLAVLFVAPVLLVMYFAGHKEFVTSIFHWYLLAVLAGPILNATRIYNLVSAYFVRRDELKWSKVNERAARRVQQKERSKGLKHSRIKDPNLPKNW